MRITNQMMVNSSISNIQGNKSQLNDLSTQLSTQKKINKPSDDPIIAIRALRLRSSLDEVTQYLGKNIPDASSWLSVTHDALDESNKIIQDLYNYCVQGSTDSYSEAERNTLAESLNKLVEAYYEQGNVDYAGRYVFTGHATDKPLTYQSDETAKDVDYTITQNFTRENLSNKTAYTNAYTNDDIIGVEIGGAVKNVIALASGVCDGIGYGDNTKAALMTRGMAEIVRVGLKLGGKIETFLGLTGMGDLIVTCTSVHSRNRKAGYLIGTGKTMEEAVEETGMVVEGIKACKAFYELKEELGIEMPITDALYQVLFNGKNAKEMVNKLLQRDKKSEIY